MHLTPRPYASAPYVHMHMQTPPSLHHPHHLKRQILFQEKMVVRFFLRV